VRNLYQMLSPQHERDPKFFIGRPEFDPVQVGIKYAEQKEGGFWLDTSITGNANTGHEFRDGYSAWKEGNPPQFGVIGPAYTPDERFEIIEYLKVHLDDPPLSDLYLEAFEGIVAAIKATLPEAGEEDKLAASWPDGQLCNLDEYLGNHSGATGLSQALKADIELIETRLDAYFNSPDECVIDAKKHHTRYGCTCGGKTRYQRGGEDYD